MVRKCGWTCVFTFIEVRLRTAFIIVYVNKNALKESREIMNVEIELNNTVNKTHI